MANKLDTNTEHEETSEAFGGLQNPFNTPIKQLQREARIIVEHQLWAALQPKQVLHRVVMLAPDYSGNCPIERRFAYVEIE